MTFEPGAPRSARMPSHTDMSRVGHVVDGAHVVAGAQTGLRRRRIVARGDDAQVVLPGELEADVAGRQRARRSRLASPRRRVR